jgi:hypothetical protein
VCKEAERALFADRDLSSPESASAGTACGLVRGTSGTRSARATNDWFKEEQLVEVASASHDVNDVTVLEITGWAGWHAVVPTTESAWAEIWAPVRDRGELWTFSRQSNGVLPCFSSLLGSARLRQDGPGLCLIVFMPADKVGKIEVRVLP